MGAGETEGAGAGATGLVQEQLGWCRSGWDAICCDMALMRYWSSEIGDWHVALVTEVGEEACTVPLIFIFSYFYAYY
jgi:hypothetical protein